VDQGRRRAKRMRLGRDLDRLREALLGWVVAQVVEEID
jgi:hypothetical protein